MTAKLLLQIEYDGAPFCGWQRQKNSTLPSVEGVLLEALRTYFSSIPSIDSYSFKMRAAGRTDAGVHAKQQYVSIEVPTIVDPSKLQAGVNALTPTTLQCFSLSTCDTAFDPRRSAHRKCYAYRIFNNRTPSVFKQANSLFVPQPLDFLAMRDAAAYLTGTKDWSSFRASDCGASTATRTIESSHIFRDSEGVLQFRIVGCGFLKQMVRILAGTLVEVGQGKRAAASIPELIELRDRSLAGQTAVAKGLTLKWIRYS